MKLPHPALWLAGDTPTEISFNDVGKAIDFLNNPPEAWLAASVIQAFPTGVWTPVLLGTVIKDNETDNGTGKAVLDRAGWTATVSPVGIGAAANILDGVASTMWSTNNWQANGQYFTVNMQTQHTFDQVTLFSGMNKPNDYPRGYALYACNDGATWGSAIVTGTPDASEYTTIVLPSPVTAQYIKLVQTGSTGAYFWAVTEVNLSLTDATTTPTFWQSPYPTLMWIRTPGWYEFETRVYWAASADTKRRVQALRVNNSYAAANPLRGHIAKRNSNGASVQKRVNNVFSLFLNAGDYVELVAYQDSGGDLSTVVGTGTANQTYLRATWVST